MLQSPFTCYIEWGDMIHVTTLMVTITFYPPWSHSLSLSIHHGHSPWCSILHGPILLSIIGPLYLHHPTPKEPSHLT